MAFVSLKQFFALLGLVTPEQFDEHGKAWRVAVESGSQESLLAFICRERGLAEDVFLQKLGAGPQLALPRTAAARHPASRPATRISTKVAFQYSVLPTNIIDGTVQVAVSNPFDTAMLNAVQFDARGPVQFALAPKVEIEKALKKYYGVGAETLDEMAEDETNRSNCWSARQGNHRRRPGSQRHQVRQPDHLGSLQGPRDGHSLRAGRRRIAHPLPH